MMTDSRLSDLLASWLSMAQQGRDVPAAELCRDCPELAGPLGEQIAILRQLNALVDAAGAAEGTTDDVAAGRQTDPDRSAGLAPDAVPGYEILEELGRGGMGIVYRALEQRTGRPVALKTMQQRDGLFLELFKKEFRYLQGVAHPNLVQLYDLKSDGQQWLLTMELVEGVSFLEHVRSAVEPAATVVTTHWAATTATGSPCTGLTPLQLGRLRESLGQLAEGIAALHAHRRIHRDLKPQNVRVTPEGRVVILDFGLATDLGPTGEHHYDDQGVMGTIPYMAPEQGRHPPVCSPASDWYSVGVMLYQALTGRLPFTGNAREVMQDKLLLDPPSSRDLCPDVPSDLEELCLALLRREPGDRPSGAEVLERLGRAPAALPAGMAAHEAVPLLGREQHLRMLDDAYAACRQGRAVLVAVHGPSGIGKSALTRHFLDRLRREGAVVLAGRCYEHESIPYKALDPLVDELGRYLRGRPLDQVESLLPRDLAALVRVFPVLAQVPAMAEAADGTRLVPDPQEVRRQAFAALRQLLLRVAKERPLVLHIDDLQWGDVDSTHLLIDLVQPPDPPPLLLLTSYRSEDADSPCLRALERVVGQGAAVDRRELAVAPLTDAETRELVVRLLGRGAEDRAGEIARESGGNPFFITELVQQIRSGEGQDAAGDRGKVSLEGLIQARVGHLPEGARRLLEVVAVSGRPLAELEAYRAAEVGTDGRILLARLDSARFLRGTGSAGEGLLETYHDRIRETVVAGLAPGPLREHHRRLADVLEESGRADPEQVAVHFEGSGNRDRAGTCYAQAAERAARALAFDQAANLYRRSLDLRPLEGAEGRALQVKLGDALANAGSGAEAGPVYLGAAEGAEAADAHELRLKAANQFLMAGYTQEGLDILGSLLRAVGLSLPRGAHRALFALILEQVRVRLRGLSFHERPATSIPPEELLRIDACQTTSHRLMMLTPLQAPLFQAKQVRLALRAGEPYRVVLALANYAGLIGAGGGLAALARAKEVSRQAMLLAERVDNPFALAYATTARGWVGWEGGEWKEALCLLERGEELACQAHSFAALCVAKHRHGKLDCLMMLGRWREIAHTLPEWLKDAQRRADHFAASTMLVHSYIPCLAADRPADAESVLHQSWQEWPQAGNVMGTYWNLYGRAEAALYRGEGEQAWGLIGRERAALSRGTFFQFLQVLFLLMVHLRGRTALGAAAGATGGWIFGRRARLLRAATRDARRLQRSQMPWAQPLAQLLRAGIESICGRKEDSLALLASADDGFEAADMRMYAAAARRQRGLLLGGEQGRALVQAADAWMAGQDVRNPARIAAMLAPGFMD